MVCIIKHYACSENAIQYNFAVYSMSAIAYNPVQLADRNALS